MASAWNGCGEGVPPSPPIVEFKITRFGALWDFIAVELPVLNA